MQTMTCIDGDDCARWAMKNDPEDVSPRMYKYKEKRRASDSL